MWFSKVVPENLRITWELYEGSLKERIIIEGMSLPGLTCNPTIGCEESGYKAVPWNNFLTFLFNCIWTQDGSLLSYFYKVRTKSVQILMLGNFVTRSLKSFKIIEWVNSWFSHVLSSYLLLSPCGLYASPSSLLLELL